MERLAYLLILFLALPSCKEVNKTPENLDPIYTDMQEDLVRAKEEVKAAKTDAKRAREQWEKASKENPQSATPKQKQRTYFSAKKRLRKAEQKVRFYEARILNRKIWARTEYAKAFEKGEDWEPKVDINRYHLNKRLQAASRNWNQRIPKLKSRIVDYNAKLLERQIAKEKELLDAEIGR